MKHKVLASVWALLALGSFASAEEEPTFCNFGYEFEEVSLTCLKLFDAKTFADGKTRCADNNNGTLAEIFHEETNDFIKGMLNSLETAWIGLSTPGGTNRYRWVHSGKYLGDNDFEDFLSRATGRETSRWVGVYMTKTGWKRSYDIYTKKKLCCQYPARHVTMVLTPPEPTPDGGQSRSIVSVDDNSWDTLQWTVMREDSTQYDSFTCRKGDTHCGSSDAVTVSTEGNGKMRSELNVVNTPRNAKITSTVNFKSLSTRMDCVAETYHPPSPPSCIHSFEGDNIVINCTTTKVYPGAQCQWYRKVNGGPRTQIDNRSTVTSNQYSEPDGSRSVTYFRSSCSLQDSVRIQEGHYTYNMTMFPHLQGLGPSHVESTVRETIQFSVSAPTQPISLSVNNQPVSGSHAPVVVSEGEEVAVSCRVEGGSPTVYQVRLVCDAAISDKRFIKAGFSLRRRLIVTRAFHLRECRCEASHVTKELDKMAVKFKVEYAPTITSLKLTNIVPNYQGDYVVSEGTSTVLCKAEGNPTPKLVINRGEERLDTQDIITTTSTEVYTTTQPEMNCERWSTFTCTATSRLGEAQGKLRPKIKCKPRFCESEKDRAYGTAPGGEGSIRICILAYPALDSNRFFIVSARTGTYADRKKFRLEFEPVADSATVQITLNVTDLATSDFGNYKIYAKNTEGGGYLKMQIKESAPPKCPTLFRVTQSSASNVTLEWLPAHDGGHAQTFRVTNLLSGDSKIVPDSGHGLVNFTDLASGTEYTFELQSKNSLGKAEGCVGNTVNVTTAAIDPESLSTEEDPSSIQDTVVPVAVCISVAVLLTLAVAVFFIRRRAKEHRDPDTDISPLAETESKDTYAVINKGTKSKELKEKAPASGDVYAVVNKTKKAETETSENKAGPEFAVCGTDAATGDLYSNISAVNADNQDIYNNVSQAKSDSSQTQTTSTQIPGRYASKEGLVYTEVEFNAHSDRPVVKVSPRVRYDRFEPVEYSEIVPGMLVGKGKEGGEKDGEKEKEEDVYEK